jgi:hypothetical protein
MRAFAAVILLYTTEVMKTADRELRGYEIDKLSELLMHGISEQESWIKTFIGFANNTKSSSSPYTD